MIALENEWFIEMSLEFVGRTCLVPSLSLACRHQEKSRRRRVDQSALQRVLSRLFLRGGCSLFYIAGFQLTQWLIFRSFAGMTSGVSGNEVVSTGVEADGQLREVT